MAKEKVDKSEKREKKEKRRSETDGVHKDKKSKKDKKDKKIETNGAEEATTTLLNTLEQQNPGAVAVQDERDVVVTLGGAEGKDTTIPVGALVPFANPLADDKTGKKVLKGVKKAAKAKCIKRGVKEVVKALRKSPTSGATGGNHPGVVVLAADISPMDVISHIPVLCEDHDVPYVYITSRAELGAAGSTKRPTSVVMITPQRQGGKKAETDEDAEDWSSSYKDLVKVVEKEGLRVKI